LNMGVSYSKFHSIFYYGVGKYCREDYTIGAASYFNTNVFYGLSLQLWWTCASKKFWKILL